MIIPESGTTKKTHLAPLYHPDTLVNPDTYIVFMSFLLTSASYACKMVPVKQMKYIHGTLLKRFTSNLVHTCHMTHISPYKRSGFSPIPKLVVVPLYNEIHFDLVCPLWSIFGFASRIKTKEYLSCLSKLHELEQDCWRTTCSIPNSMASFCAPMPRWLS